MKLIAGVVVVAAIVAAIILIAGGDSSNGYVVRAIFDNGSFMVNGEQVRVAGANVGTIKSVSVSLPGEPTAEENGKFVDVSGKAVIELKITDPSFQDFRQDASCEIRPQSLIGEKYVNCRPTMPRAPGRSHRRRCARSRRANRGRASTCCRWGEIRPASTPT